jgi:ribosomal-protein-alanine N-acetyltransferase
MLKSIAKDGAAQTHPREGQTPDPLRSGDAIVEAHVSITIEPIASEQDLDAVLAIETASFTSPWTREMYLAELQNVGMSFCYLARDESARVVGFCSFWRVLDELHINNLAVHPSVRRRGIGASLLSFVLNEGARMGARRATLEVRRSNDAARHLYERLGFAAAGVRRAYYSNPVEDALVLWRENLSAG